MNFKNLHEWAVKNGDKSPSEYMAMGMKSDTRFVKVRSMIKDIIKRTDEMRIRIEQNNKNIAQIEDYIKLLEGYGVDVLLQIGEKTSSPKDSYDKKPVGSGLPN